MKPFQIILLLACNLLFSCQMDPEIEELTPKTSSSTPLEISLGNKLIHLRWPKDSVMVRVGNIPEEGTRKGLSVNWSLINGPSSPKLNHPTDPYCLITNLQQGVYGFEVKIVAEDGRMAKDTLNVIVGKLSQNPKEISMDGANWNSGPFWNRIILDNFASHLARSGIKLLTYFELYIKTIHTQGQWELIENDQSFTPSSRYIYSIDKDGKLLLFDLTKDGKVGEMVELKVKYD